MRWGRVLPVVGGLLLLVITVAAMVFSRGPSRPKHVLLISLDTLRADHVGPYKPEAFAHVQTPSLDALTREGIHFDQSYTAAPTTLNSHTALLTGTWPHTHGVARNSFVVPEENVFLSEMLLEKGWQTAAFIGAYPLHERYGFNQGFSHWDTDFDGSARGVPRGSQRSAEVMTDTVLSYLDAEMTDSGLPGNHFLFLHYFDVHSPYMAPEPYDRMYRTDALPVHGGTGQMFKMRADLRRKRPGSMNTSKAFEAQYQGEVTYLDHHLGRLFEGLKQRGVWDDLLVIVTADHGETFAEHPRLEPWDHGYMVYDETIRIPLIVRMPRAYAADTRVSGMVSNIDITPTILELLSQEIPESVEGESFAEALRAQPFTGRDHIFSEATKPYGPRYEKPGSWRNLRKARTIRTQEHKLVSRPVHRREMLYNVDEDPMERRDVRTKGGKQPVFKTLKGQLKAWDAQAQVSNAEYEGSHEGTQMLEALGYMEGEDDAAVDDAETRGLSGPSFPEDVQ